jgi:hypothetical protein
MECPSSHVEAMVVAEADAAGARARAATAAEASETQTRVIMVVPFGDARNGATSAGLRLRRDVGHLGAGAALWREWATSKVDPGRFGEQPVSLPTP